MNNNNFLIIRHGETNNNDKGLNRGFLDIPLNMNGKKGALRVAKLIKKHNLDALISSPLGRAKETARIIKKENGTPILETHDSLKPWDVGMYEGKSIKTTLPILHDYMEHPDKVIPKGESFNSFKSRSLKGLQEIHNKYPDKKLGLVTHHRIERFTASVASPKGGKGKFFLPIQKQAGIDPASFKIHKWDDVFPNKK